jgi:hypothetical protein
VPSRYSDGTISIRSPSVPSVFANSVKKIGRPSSCRRTPPSVVKYGTGVAADADDLHEALELRTGVVIREPDRRP